MISIIKQRKIWFTLSAILVAASLISILIWRLNLGIDFTGGSLLEIEFFTQRPTNQQISAVIEPLAVGDVVVQPIGENNVILRFKEVDQETHQKIIDAFKENFKVVESGQDQEQTDQALAFEEKRFDSIGPTIGQELKRKTVWAIIIVLVAIVLYIAWAFRKVSKPVASWKYGLIAVVALFHDVIITVGVFAILGKLYNLEINASFVAAILTVLGYSVNDTIVVFDRTRENLIRNAGEKFDQIVEASVNQVLTRSINTSLTTLIVLFSIFLLGGQTVRDFVLALIIGIGIGTYSSIFLASPLLVVWEKIRSKT